MPEETEAGNGVTLDAIRDLLSEQMGPLNQRVAALEQAGGSTDNPDKRDTAPEPPAAPDESAEMKALREKLANAEKRSKRLEAEFAERAARPQRVGRARRLATGSPSQIRSTMETCLLEAREAGHVRAFAHVVERSMPMLTENRVPSGRKAGENDGVSTRQLEDLLRSGLAAAYDDGLIVNPAEQASWG